MSADVSRGAERPIDPEVARVLVENHREFLRFLERRLGHRDLAEDILQEAFARGLDKLATLRDALSCRRSMASFRLVFRSLPGIRSN